MFRQIAKITAALTLGCASVFAAGNQDVAIKYTGPSGQGEMVIYCPKTGYTNQVCATNGNVIFPGTVTAAAVITNGDDVVLNNVTIRTNLATVTETISGTLTAATVVVTSGITVPALGIANAALAGKADLATSIAMSIATNANGGTNVVTFTAKDLNGVAIATPTAFRFWISDDGQGTPAAVAGDVAISSGIELQQVVDKADYWIMSTNLAGTVIATITDTPGGTNYIHVMAPCGKISKAISAFKVP